MDVHSYFNKFTFSTKAFPVLPMPVIEEMEKKTTHFCNPCNLCYRFFSRPLRMFFVLHKLLLKLFHCRQAGFELFGQGFKQFIF